MTRYATQSLAAVLAVVFAITSIGTIVTVPPASANAGSTTSLVVELA